MVWNLPETHLWLKGLTPAMKNELVFIPSVIQRTEGPFPQLRAGAVHGSHSSVQPLLLPPHLPHVEPWAPVEPHQT